MGGPVEFFAQRLDGFRVRLALLVELGEKRRIGNKLGPDDAKAAVTAFDAVLREFIPAPVDE